MPTEQMDRLSTAGACVHALGQGYEANAAFCEACHCFHQGSFIDRPGKHRRVYERPNRKQDDLAQSHAGLCFDRGHEAVIMSEENPRRVKVEFSEGENSMLKLPAVFIAALFVLSVPVGAQAAPDCGKWLTRDFWQEAGAADVEPC